MPAIDLSVLCIPAECDNIKKPYNGEIASRWDAYCYATFAGISLRLCSISLRSFRITFAAYLPTHIKSLRDFFQSSLNNHRGNLYIISLLFSPHPPQNNPQKRLARFRGLFAICSINGMPIISSSFRSGWCRRCRWSPSRSRRRMRCRSLDQRGSHTSPKPQP